MDLGGANCCIRNDNVVKSTHLSSEHSAVLGLTIIIITKRGVNLTLPRRKREIMNYGKEKFIRNLVFTISLIFLLNLMLL